MSDKRRKVKRIQLLIPFSASRGGAESLYQLAHTLNTLEQNVEIVYTLDWRSSLRGRSPLIPPSMLKYTRNLKISENLSDEIGTVVIIPEIFTGYIRNIKKALVTIYWLSVDNYFVGYRNFKSGIGGFIRTTSLISTYAHPHFKMPMSLGEIGGRDFIHLAQSDYSQKFLQVALGKPSLKLCDYISNIPAFNESFFNLLLRENTILYNPVKGKKTTQYLLENWESSFIPIPIENMTHEEVRKMLLRAAIYIDFGEHPGRDRIPREALLCGCCLISGIRGSAAFSDVPISWQFKLAEDIHLLQRFKDSLDFLSKENDCKNIYAEAYGVVHGDYESHKVGAVKFIEALNLRS